jgi:hypothetical protein
MEDGNQHHVDSFITILLFILVCITAAPLFVWPPFGRTENENKIEHGRPPLPAFQVLVYLQLRISLH